MRKLMIAASLMTILVSCGNSNKLSSAPATTSGTSPIVTADVNFEGSYDIIRMETNDCGASIQITQECGGYRLHSNINPRIEEFCNINRNLPGSVTPPPDRDGKVSVTQEGNQLKAVVRIGRNQEITNTLTLNNNGILVKSLDFPNNRRSRCIFQKR